MQAGSSGATAAWLAIVLAGLTWWTANDIHQYRRFVALTDSRQRRTFYRRWTLQSLVLLGGTSVLTLWGLGRLDAVITLPPEFSRLMPRGVSVGDVPRTADGILGMMTGVLLATAIGLVAWVRRARALATPMLGEVAALIPRNAAEQLAALPLCLNAGVSEELFFRLALPLLVTTVTGSAPIGLAVAAVAFGLAHWYQGWKGVVGTMLVGALLTATYLGSGSLLRVMVIHALIDVVALIIRPSIAARLAARPAPAHR